MQIGQQRVSDSYFESNQNMAINEQTNEHDISITISSFKVVSNNLSKYVTYNIEGYDRNGLFQTNRRYNHFKELYKTLIMNWPGCFIPAIPDKKKTGNFKDEFVEQRKKLLQYFLKSMSNKDYMYYGNEMQTFLRSGDLKYQQESYDQIIDKYMQHFQILQGKEIDIDINMKITRFQKYIIHIDQTLINLKQIAYNKMTSQQNYFRNLRLYFQMMDKYDSQVSGEQDNHIFKNNFGDQLQELDITQGLNGVYEMLQIEILEIASFTKVINQRNKYLGLKDKAIEEQKNLKNDLHKILAGKTTINTILVKDKKEIISQLENKINEQNNKIDKLNTLCDIVNGILGYIEINQFKKQKIETYYSVIKVLSTSLSKNIRSVVDIWQKIQSISTV